MKKTIRIGNRDFGLVRCLICGKERYRRMLYVKKLKHHFCSKACLMEARRRGLYGKPILELTTQCAICGLSVRRKRSEASSTGLYFCSHKCQSEGIRRRLVPTNPVRNHSPKAGRQRARYIFSEKQPCSVCGKVNGQRHHKDGNPDNNHPSNIAWLCPKHHVHADRLAHMKKIRPAGTAASLAVCKRDSSGRFAHHKPL